VHLTTASTNGLPTLDIGRRCVDAGLSVIPIAADGSKAPDGRLLPRLPKGPDGELKHTWDPFKERLPTDDELIRWFGIGRLGIAIICGRVSGNLETMDFDREAETIFPEWCALVESEQPGLVAKLSVTRTPKPGFHTRYRCREIDIPGNMKLAMDPSAPKKEQVLIETRGEGGYALAPGCPPECHETGRTYDYVSGPPLHQIQDITAAEREILIRAARSFNRAPATDSAGARASSSEGDALRPGDDYNRRGPDWLEILDGWSLARKAGKGRYLRRPGKERGWSATVGVCTSKNGVELLAVFSSNAAPFEGPQGGKPCTCYSKFAAYTLLHHQGDFKAAAKALAAQGYGEQRTTDGARMDSRDRPPGASSSQSTGSKSSWELGPLSIRPNAAHRAPSGKVSVSLAVLRGSLPIDHATLSSSASGRASVVKLLLARLAGTSVARDEVERQLGEILAAAADEVNRQAANGQLTLVRDIVKREVPAVWKLTFRTTRGAWSEVRAADVSRHEFTAFAPNCLLDIAAGAGDAPRTASGSINRPALMQAVQAELGALWSDLLSQLPSASNAELTPDMEAAKPLRQVIVECWQAGACHERVRHDDGSETTHGASLVSKVRKEWGKPRPDEARPRWRKIHSHLLAWWRPEPNPEGEIRPRLAMHYALISQTIKVKVHGVNDKDDFAKLGRSLGLIEAVSGRTWDSRFAVLSWELSEELLADMVDLQDGDDTGQERAETPPAT
jgi:hypothetical protein